MNKSIFGTVVLLLSLLLFACDRKPFVESKLKFEDTGNNCGQLNKMFRMVSNFAGERYEFQKCLPTDFVSQQMETSRKGDTVVVHFPDAGKSSKVFQITLDIDSYPKYNYIAIDGETFAIGPAALNK